MAGTVTTDLAFFTGATGGSSVADAITDWTAYSIDTVQFIQGIGAATSYSAATTTVRTISFASAATNVTDKVIYFWYALGSVGWLNTKANGGLTIRIESSATDYLQWNVAGSDTLPHNGFICHAIHTSQTADASGGTCNKAAINKITITANGSFPGKAWTWVDALRYGTGLSIKGGTAVAPATLQDLATAEETTANRYGVLNKLGGVYYIQGKLNIGSTTAAEDTYFKDTSQVVVFKNALITSGFYEIKVQGNSTATTQKVFFGNKSGTAGIQGISFRCESGTQTPKFKFTATNTYVTDLGVYGSGFVSADTISLPVYSATREVLNTSFESCAEVLADTCTVTNCNFISSSTRAVRMSSISHNITSSNFISCAQAVEINNAGTYTFNALKFTGNTYDVENSSTGAVTINATNGSNPGTYKYTNTGGVFGTLSCQSYTANTTTFTDETTDINNATTNDVALPPIQATTAGDAIYFGDAATFTGVTVNVGTAGVYSNITINWEYWNGSIWTAITTVVDNTNGFKNSSTNTVNFTAPTDWATTTVNGTIKYWIRARASWTTGQTITTAPLGTQGFFGSSVVNNTVTLEVNGVKTGTEPTNYVRCRIEKLDGTAIMNQEAQTSYGTDGFYKATMQYNYPGTPVDVKVRTRYKGYLPFETNGQITSVGLTVTAVWQIDANFT